jgi:hypothetical protein
MGLHPDVLQRLDSALAGADSWFTVYSRLSNAAPEGEQDRYRALVWAFGYLLISPTDVEQRQREGSPFGALFEFETGRLPPPLHDVPHEEVAVWATAFKEIADPRLRSRIGDLLWERRVEPRYDLKARDACEALLALAEVDGWNDMESTEGLVRALELASMLRDEQLERRVVDKLITTADAELGHGPERPGITYTLLEALARLPATRRPTELRELVDRTEQGYGNDPYHFEATIDLLTVIAPAEQAQLRRRQAERWREAARAGEGILRAAFLERALDVARMHGPKELADELRVELGQLTEEDLGLKLVSSEVQVPAERVEQFLDLFVSFDSWQKSLTAFGRHGPPGGEPDESEREYERRRQAHPMSFLVTRTLVDPDSAIPIVHATDDASHRLLALTQQRQLAGSIWATFATDILHRFTGKYGRPSRDDLTAFFTTDLIDSAAAERIARAFELFWDGAADDSAHVIAPRLEGVLRNLARELGLPIIREPEADRPGRVRTLGELMPAMEGRLPSAGWHDYLNLLLRDPLGFNLRNVIAHGVRAQISEHDSALLLHAACFLRLMQVSGELPNDPGLGSPAIDTSGRSSSA